MNHRKTLLFTALFAVGATFGIAASAQTAAVAPAPQAAAPAPSYPPSINQLVAKVGMWGSVDSTMNAVTMKSAVVSGDATVMGTARMAGDGAVTGTLTAATITASVSPVRFERVSSLSSSSIRARALASPVSSSVVA